MLTILLAAFLFRFWQIHTLPGGLFPDEAANGLDVNSILKGNLRPFFERGNGREALFFYFLAGAVALFGRGPWQHHIVSAGFGFFEVLATYFLVKRLFGKNTALLASFFMAVSSYAVEISRTAFRANTLPLFTILTLLFLVKFFQSQDRKTKFSSAILAGIFTALGFYTYISFRMMIPFILGFGIILFFSQRHRIRELIAEYWKYKTAYVAAFIVTVFPIAYYFATHPGSFGGRTGQVSIFTTDLNHGDVLGTAVLVFKKTILSFFTQGDLNWRHNVSGFPFLSPLLSPFFAVALIIFTIAAFRMLKQAWQKNLQAETVYQAMIAVLFWFMMIPELLTAEGIPHGLRLIGVIPAIFILPAWMFDKIWQKINSYSLLQSIRIIFPAVLIFCVFFYNYYLYFGVSANSPEYYYAFRSDLTEVSNYLNARHQKNSTYLSLDKFSVQTTDYLTTETKQPYILLDPASTWKVNLKKGDQVVFTQSTLFDRLKFIQYHPAVKLIKTEQNQFKQPVMLVFEEQ